VSRDIAMGQRDTATFAYLAAGAGAAERRVDLREVRRDVAVAEHNVVPPDGERVALPPQGEEGLVAQGNQEET